MTRRNWSGTAAKTMALGIVMLGLPAVAQVTPQCPSPKPADVRCMHLAAGDGFVRMADGEEKYIFGFSNMEGVSPAGVLKAGLLNASFPAPPIVVNQGEKLYLSLTNVGMAMRPDLFDPHSVHWHGFPNSSTVFDGLPDSGLAINMGATLTYFYNVVEPGTYMYHCHVEAAEHMQMGMLGSLYVRAAQDKAPAGVLCGGSFTHVAGNRYAYNDCDGSTRYDVDFPIQIGSFDPDFHDSSEGVQPLPFALMKDKYPMLNGRGYPDTVNPDPPAPPLGNGEKTSQWENARISAQAGKRILLRISNLNVTRFYTLQSPGIRMTVVGKDAKLLRGPDGKSLSYLTNSVTLGGGESYDVILDTAGVPAGTYFLHASDLNYLTNHTEVTAGMGGMLTEIVLN